MEKKSFVINVSGARTTEEVIAAGKYDWKNNLINGENFPMRPPIEGSRKIVFMEFDHDPTSEEVLAEAASQGLERPRYEDALFFGEQHPEEQRTALIVFLNDPWTTPSRYMGVLVLNCDAFGRGLRLGSFGEKGGRHCRFAFVQP